MDATEARLLREIDPAVLGQRIRELRVARSLRQAHLAGEDVSVGYVSRIEAGQRRPEARVLELIASRLNVSVGQLLSGVSAQERDEVRLALDFAELSLESGDAAEAERRTADVLGQTAVAALPDLHERARFLHGRALEALGRLEDAITELEALVEHGEPGARWLTAGTALSRCYRESGDLTRAIQVGESVMGRLADRGLAASDEAVQLTVTVAAAYFEQGDTSYAVRLCRRGIEQADAVDSAVGRASAYWNAGLMEANRGAVGAALPMVEKALALLGEGRDSRNLARLRTQLAHIQLRCDPPEIEDAEVNLRRSRSELLSSSASAVDLARCDVLMAQARYLAGDLVEARSLAERVHEAVRTSAPLLAADARVIQGQVAAAEGDLPAADVAYRDAVLTLSGVGADRSVGQLWFELGSLFESVGNQEASLDAYRRAAASVGMRSRVSTVTRV